MSISLYDGRGSTSTYAVQEEALLTEKEATNEVIIAQQKHRKLACEGGVAQVYITPDKVTISNADTGIAVNQNGIILSGKMHLAKDLNQIRINGFWTLNPELLTTLPSTLYTPISVLVYEPPPYATMVANLASVVSSA